MRSAGLRRPPSPVVDVINCGTFGSACAKTYGYGTSISLSAIPDPGYSLTAWSGACSGTGACPLTMDADKTVGATFTPITPILTVSAPLHGTITSADNSINCGTGGSACSRTYDYGTSVSLSVIPDSGYILTASSGSCSGTGVCPLTMDADKSVGATFTRITHALTTDAAKTAGATTIQQPTLDREVNGPIAGPIAVPITATNIPPTASVAFAAASAINAGETLVSFDAVGSRDSDGGIASYIWSWGDGTPEQSTDTPAIGHVFADTASGCLEVTHTVLLTVVDDKGGVGTASQKVKVTERPAPGSAGCQ